MTSFFANLPVEIVEIYTEKNSPRGKNEQQNYFTYANNFKLQCNLLQSKKIRNGASFKFEIINQISSVHGLV